MPDIKIYGFAASSYTWSTLLVAEEKGITHELEMVEFGSDAHKALHPFAKSPSWIMAVIVFMKPAQSAAI